MLAVWAVSKEIGLLQPRGVGLVGVVQPISRGLKLGKDVALLGHAFEFGLQATHFGVLIQLGPAHGLHTIFTNLGRRAGKNFGVGYLETAETYLKLALRAQNQCRATLETLAAIKNPPIVFAKQANISNGHQQMNNGSFASNTRVPAHAETIENRPNELMEHDHGEWLDTRAAGTASTGNKAMATVAIIDGTANRSRQSKRAA